MDFSIYHNNHQNCFQIVLSAMLKRKGMKEEKFWNQSGLYFQKTNTGWRLTPYYMEFEEVLRRQLVEYHSFLLESGKEAVNRVKEFVNEEHSVGIYVDIFQLPYCMYYQRNHDGHILEIVGVESDHVIVCDHYYHYHGPLSLQQLQIAVSSFIHHIEAESCQLFYLVANNSTTFDLNEAIANNIAVMEGKRLYNLQKASADGFVGLAALPEIKKMVLSLVMKESENKALQLDHLFKDIKEIGYSRHNFHVFLKQASEDELASHIEEASQSWSVLANLILKAFLTKNFAGMLPRIQRRFDRIMKIEQENLERMKKLAQSI